MTDTPPRNETELNRQILALGCGPTRLFRNNIGAYQDKNGEWIKYGVCNPGGSDTIGWHVITVTPDMVGCQLPVFVGIEGKFGRNKPTVPQANFTAAINNSGGIGVVAYSVDAVRSALRDWRPIRK